MPTKRDDAAYKAEYRDRMRKSRHEDIEHIARMLMIYMNNPMPTYPDRVAANIDAYTDELARRGLCASVLDWHKKPAGDELPW